MKIHTKIYVGISLFCLAVSAVMFASSDFRGAIFVTVGVMIWGSYPRLDTWLLERQAYKKIIEKE